MRGKCAGVCLLVGLSWGCDGESGGGDEPLAEGTCVSDYTGSGFGNESSCVYPNAFYRANTSGTEWCSGDWDTFHPPADDGTLVPCADLGYPVRCSNCTGRDFYYAQGKVCPRCDRPGGGKPGGGGGDDCDYSGCVSVCVSAGGTNCGEDCKCD